MIDLHTHILPGLDDGAANESIALAMCRMAVADGITVLTATPHICAGVGVMDVRGLPCIAERLRRRIAEEGIALDLRLAGEIALQEDLLPRYLSGEWPAFDSTRRYILLEMPDIPNGFSILRRVVEQLRHVGARPVLAHPERLSLLKRPGELEELLALGALVQVTAQGLPLDRSRFGHRARTWMEQGLVHLVASDAHDLQRRPPLLSPAREWIRAHFGETAARLLTHDNPQRILNGEDILCV